MRSFPHMPRQRGFAGAFPSVSHHTPSSRKYLRRRARPGGGDIPLPVREECFPCLPVSGGPVLPVAKAAGICYGLYTVLPAPSGTAGRHGLTKEDVWQR